MSEAEGAAAVVAEHWSGSLVPRGAVRRQRRDGDNPECWIGVCRSWPSLEKKELAVELEIRYKAGNKEIKG